jgi:hypothetical protein
MISTLLRTELEASTALTRAASTSPQPVKPHARGDFSCGFPGCLLSQHSSPPAAHMCHIRYGAPLHEASTQFHNLQARGHCVPDRMRARSPAKSCFFEGSVVRDQSHALTCCSSRHKDLVRGPSHGIVGCAGARFRQRLVRCGRGRIQLHRKQGAILSGRHHLRFFTSLSVCMPEMSPGQEDSRLSALSQSRVALKISLDDSTGSLHAGAVPHAKDTNWHPRPCQPLSCTGHVCSLCEGEGTSRVMGLMSRAATVP